MRFQLLRKKYGNKHFKNRLIYVMNKYQIGNKLKLIWKQTLMMVITLHFIMNGKKINIKDLCKY